MKNVFFTMSLVAGCLTASFAGNHELTPKLTPPPDCTVCPLEQCNGGIPTRPPGLVSTARINYGDEAIGQTHDFDLKLNFLTPGNHTYLGFDLAYTYFPGRHDSMQVMISMNCGQSWETLFYSGGEDLSTARPTEEFFSPKPDQWQSYRFNLHAYSGTAKVRIRFFNGNGNNLYLDNLGFTEETTAAKEVPVLKSKLSPNPFTGSAMLQFDRAVNNGTLVIVDELGQTIRQINNIEGDQWLVTSDSLNPGMYWYNLLENGANKCNGKFIISN